MSDLTTDASIHGSCASDFVGVRDAFERNFTLGDEVGAAVAVWVDGSLVVNLWGGWADAARTRPWQQNTLTTVLSGTKGLSATCVHQLADRGELDLQAPVAHYWLRVRPGGQTGHHAGDGDEPPLRRDRAAHPDALGTGRGLGLRLRATGRRRALVGAGHRPGLPHDHLRFHHGRGVPPGHRPHDRPVSADRDRRTVRGRRPHRVAAGRTAPLRRAGQQAARPGPAGRREGPGYPTSLAEHPKAGLSISMGFAPTTNSARTI